MLTFTVSFHLRQEEDTIYRWLGANGGLFFLPLPSAVVIKCHTHAEQALLQREDLDINNTHVSFMCMLRHTFSEHRVWEDGGLSVLFQ